MRPEDCGFPGSDRADGKATNGTAHAPGAPVAAGGDLRGRRALVVDDSAAVRLDLAAKLATLGISACEAADGASALDRLVQAVAHRERFDVAILDLQMPGLDGIALARRIRAMPELAALPLVLHTGFSERCHREEARAAGIAAYLHKPVLQAELCACLSEILATRDDGSPTPGPAAEGGTGGGRLRILIAEDNLVNQKVARRMVERLGHGVDVVENGREALEALFAPARGGYDLVLMDCQMPEMDGFTATVEIRRREGEGRRTPIIAVTAYAMQGDRERCLAAGMDDYVSKPVRPDVLRAVLRSWEERLHGGPRTAGS